MTQQKGQVGQPADRQSLLLKIKELEDANHMLAHNLRGAASNIKLLSEILMDRKKETPQISYNQLALEDSNILGDDEILECIQQSSDALINTLERVMETVNHQLNEREALEDCDIEHIVNSITHQLSGFMLQKKAKIFLDLAAKQVKCAKTYMESLLYNLISNSIKYSKPGVPLKIEISTHMEEGRAVLEVKDNGIGIDMEKYGDKIFMLNQTFHKGYDSRGVGLYITKEHIEAMGGQMRVKSKVNAGTEFVVVL